MGFARPTLETIYQRIKADMETRLTGGVQVPRVSLLGVLNIVFAGSIHLCYGFLAWLARQIFVDTADNIGLERWGNILGLPQKPATFSTGEVAPTGVVTTLVPLGTILLNSEGYEFALDADYLVGQPSPGTATAVEEEAASNTTDSTLTLASPVPDVDTDVPVVSGFDNAVDLETRDAWVLRLLHRFQNPPASGTAADYIRWALGVSGVGKAWAFGGPDWLGAGTVGLFVATGDLAAVSAGVLTEVETRVDAERPLTAAMSYLNITPLDITYDISLTPNVSQLQDAIDTNLQNLYILDSAPGGTILLSQMRAAIGAAGPDDYEITEIYKGGIAQGVGNVVAVLPETSRFVSATYSELV